MGDLYTIVEQSCGAKVSAELDFLTAPQVTCTIRTILEWQVFDLTEIAMTAWALSRDTKSDPPCLVPDSPGNLFTELLAGHHVYPGTLVVLGHKDLFFF